MPPGKSSECIPTLAFLGGRSTGLSIKDKWRARKKPSSCSPLSTGNFDPLSGVYASSGAGRYEERGGGVTDPGEYLIREGLGMITSLASSKGRGVLVVLLTNSAG